jgi:uncharacterized protein YprB with RNaseH-like and TPR domain
MSIKDKLSRLDKSASVERSVVETLGLSDDLCQEFETEFAAKLIREKNSYIVLKENFYPLENLPFFQELRDNNFVLKDFHRITLEPAAEELNLRGSLFIDLETTGLSGGAGTYAFLIGLGHIELDHIVVRQYLLPDFQYEWLLLKYIENNLVSFKNIISFNGKSFDIPLLGNRFILNRMDSVLDELIHIDVLYAARRLWKKRVSACDLENLEYVILGQERQHDVPSEMIPHIYFEFIRKRRAAILRDVLEHNFYDIANMVLLFLTIGQAVENPLNKLKEHEDIYSLARFYYQRKFFGEALPLLEYLNNCPLDKMLKKDVTFLLSMAYKKMGDFEKSSLLFKRLLRSSKDHPEAIEELAKYYEHREKNYSAALELVEQSISHITLLEQLGKKSPLLQTKASLQYRHQRLMRKLQRTMDLPDDNE